MNNLRNHTSCGASCTAAHDRADSLPPRPRPELRPAIAPGMRAASRFLRAGQAYDMSRALRRLGTLRRRTLRHRRKSLGPGQGIRVDRSIVIHRSPDELYGAWRNLEWLGSQLSHVESVRESDECQSRWRMVGPGGMAWEWDAEIVRDDPGRLIAWQSLPGSDVENAGSVHFTPVDDGAATDVHVVLRYNPAGRNAGRRPVRYAGQRSRAPDRGRPTPPTPNLPRRRRRRGRSRGRGVGRVVPRQRSAFVGRGYGLIASSPRIH